MQIAFHTPILYFRGSMQALYKYAHYNETILNNKSVIITDFCQFKSEHQDTFKWISKRFCIFFYFSIEHLKNYLIQNNFDYLYMITYGTNNKLSVLNDTIPLLIHCVFDMSEPHGHKYIAVSETLALKFGYKLFVPHIVDSDIIGNSEINFRDELNIPKEALVFTSITSPDLFNIEFTKQVISEIVREHSNYYFMFMNIIPWDFHQQIIYFQPTVDIDIKCKFIQTSDAMIVSERLGHTFGLSISEYSINNKPIICYNGLDVWNKAHIDILGDRGIYFDNPLIFKDILLQFDKNKYLNMDLNAYKDYTPIRVMNIFRDIFLT